VRKKERIVSDANTSQGGPKMLRIGVIQGVRVIEERILPRKGAVTFGSGEGNTFSFASSDLPKSVTVFELKGDAYELVIDDAMQGRLENPDGKKDFAAIKASTSKQGNAYRVPLSDASKGRVRLSPEITVLFHFVAPPPVAAAAPMPPEVSQGLLKSIEPIFTAVLTASFLVHFGFGIFVQVTEPPAPPTLDDLKQLVERIEPPKVETKLPPPPPKQTDKDDGKKEGPGKNEPEPGGGKKEPAGGGDDGGGKKEPASGGGAKAGGGSGGTGNREAIRQSIAGKGILQLIGGRGGGGGGGGAAGSVFGSGGAISDDIGTALAGTAGVGIAGGAGGGDGITRRGSGGGGGGGDGTGGIGGAAVGIGDLQTAGGGTVDTGSKQATKVVARVQADDIEAVDGKIDKKSVAATIRRRQDGFQGCYETALKANSKLAGKLVVEFTIGDDGKVTEARVVKDGVGSGEVSSCVVSLLKRLKFPAPADGEVTISNTFVFQPGG
jgi:outer membrane biosynthesis protein TonB